MAGVWLRSLLVWIACLVTAQGWAHGGFDARIALADQRVAEDPADPKAWVARAQLHRRHGDYAEALADLAVAGRLPGAPANLEYFRALVHVDAGRPAEAERLLRQFLAEQPVHPAAREAHARALVALDRPLEAARAYDVLITQQPVPIPDHYVSRAHALAQVGPAHLEEAIEGLDQGIDRLGPVITLARLAIELELRRGATDAALARIDRLLEGATRPEGLLAERAGVLVRADRPLAARESFELALAALERLPARKRRTLASARLEAEIRAGLTQLEPPGVRAAGEGR